MAAWRIPINDTQARFLLRAARHPLKAWRAFRPRTDMPSYVWIEITNRCNLRCRSCSKFWGHHDSSTDMDIDLFERLYKQIAPHARCINVTGVGEALYHQDAPKIFDILARSRSYVVEITTNGLAVDDPWLQRFASMPCIVTFSLDGADAETHRFNRPKSDFEQIRNALEQARAMELASPHPAAFPFKRRVNTLIMRNNMHQMADIVRWAAHLGLDMLRFIFLCDWGFPAAFWREQNPLADLRELAVRLEEARKLARDLAVNLVAPAMAPPQPDAPAHPAPFLANVCRPSFATARGYPLFTERYCHTPCDAMYFAVNGRASVCCAFWSADFGDARKQSVAEIWNGLPFRRLRVAMTTGAHASYCRMCDLPFGLAQGNPQGL